LVLHFHDCNELGFCGKVPASDNKRGTRSLNSRKKENGHEAHRRITRGSLVAERLLLSADAAPVPPSAKLCGTVVLALPSNGWQNDKRPCRKINSGVNFSVA
jgi:hypothetical protein